MSGPKLSQAELERRRKEELERQRLEALRRLQEAQTAYQNACDALQRVRDAAAQMLLQVDPVYRSGVQNSFTQYINTLRSVPVTDSKEPSVYQDAAAQMNRMVQDSAAALQKLLGKAIDRSHVTQRIAKANAAYSSFQASVDASDGELGVLQLDFTCNYDQQLVADQMQALLQHYTALAARQDIPDLAAFSKKAAADLQQKLKDPAQSAQLDQMRSHMQSLINMEEELIRQWKARRALYNSYTAIAALTNTAPKGPSDFPDTKSLENEIARLRQLYRHQDEMDFIADQINAVMADMGYTFVSSHVLHRDGSETDCSLYQADDKTGVAVYTDQNGAVMMRMTVLGDDPDITDDDRDFSLQRQIDFCASHADLVAALADRGVYLKQRSYLAPHKKYTFKVNMKSSAVQDVVQQQQQQVQQQRLDRRRRRRANKKMRSL